MHVVSPVLAKLEIEVRAMDLIPLHHPEIIFIPLRVGCWQVANETQPVTCQIEDTAELVSGRRDKPNSVHSHKLADLNPQSTPLQCFHLFLLFLFLPKQAFVPEFSRPNPSQPPFPRSCNMLPLGMKKLTEIISRESHKDPHLARIDPPWSA